MYIKKDSKKTHISLKKIQNYTGYVNINPTAMVIYSKCINLFLYTVVCCVFCFGSIRNCYKNNSVQSYCGLVR